MKATYLRIAVLLQLHDVDYLTRGALESSLNPSSARNIELNL